MLNQPVRLWYQVEFCRTSLRWHPEQQTLTAEHAEKTAKTRSTTLLVCRSFAVNKSHGECARGLAYDRRPTTNDQF
jgi:hypothetical protein